MACLLAPIPSHSTAATLATRTTQDRIQKDKTFFYLVYEGVRERQQDSIQDRTLPPACHILADQNGNFYNDSAIPLPAGLVPQFPSGLPANAYYSSTGFPITQTPGTNW